MKNFLEDQVAIDGINELLRLHRKFVIDNMEEVDSDVEKQKTRFEKFWCWLRYGHLPDKNGICKRCGKKLIINK